MSRLFNFKRTVTGQKMSDSSELPPPDSSSYAALYWDNLLEPTALPVVTEGNEDADWALWAEAVMFQREQSTQ